MLHYERSYERLPKNTLSTRVPHAAEERFTVLKQETFPVPLPFQVVKLVCAQMNELLLSKNMTLLIYSVTIPQNYLARPVKPYSKKRDTFLK